MKKLSLIKKMITINTPPIKVRKKDFGIHPKNSFKFLKPLRLSNPLYKRVLKKKNIIINSNIIIKKNLDKYNSTPVYFYKKLTNQILFNLHYKLVRVFKDYLIWNEVYDYFMNFYSLNKSNELLPRLGIYYGTYTLFIPKYFPLMDVKDILKKYIKNKLKLLEMTRYEDDLRDEFIDIERNIIDCNISSDKSNNYGNAIKDSKELISNEINKENNEQKLINSSDIKTENSNSVSNYFGIESIIKSKETSISSIYPENEKYVNFSSLLGLIKNKNKKDNNKIKFNLSLELASIIQLFEENNKKKIKIVKNNKKINDRSIKNSKDLKINKKLLRIGNQNLTYRNIWKIQSKENSKKNKNLSNSLKNKKKLNSSKIKKISDNINSSSKNSLFCKTDRNINLNKIRLFPITIKSEANTKRKYYHNKENKIKDNSHKIRNSIYKSILSTKNIKNNNIYSITQNKKMSLSKKQTKINIIKKIKKIYEDSKVPKNNKAIKSKSKNKNKEKNDCSLNKTCEYSLIYISPSNILKNSLKSAKTIQKSNKSLSEDKNLYMNKIYSNIGIKKFIYVKKKESNNYIFENKTNRKLINTIDSSFNTLNSSNKILVNKMENFRKSIKNKNILNTPKNKKIVNFINSNTIESKNSLNHNHMIEKDFSTFIPQTVMKKRFINRIYKEKLLNKPFNNSSMKKHEVPSKYFITYSSINGNKSKVNINLKKNNKNKFASKINIKNRKNIKIMTKFNKFMTIAPKNTISFYKKDYQSDLRNSSKFSIFSLNESNPSYKKRNTIFKDNIRKMKKIMPYTDRTLETNHKKNLIINSNLSNDIKFNSQTEDDKISIKSNKIKKSNNNLNFPYTTNSISNKNSFRYEYKKMNKNRTTNLIKNFTIGNKYLSKNNKKISKQKSIINNNHYYTIDFSNRIAKQKNQNI